MRVSLVENETVLAQTLPAGLDADGFAVDVANDGVDGLHPTWTPRARRDRRQHDTIGDKMLPGPRG